MPAGLLWTIMPVPIWDQMIFLPAKLFSQNAKTKASGDAAFTVDQ